MTAKSPVGASEVGEKLAKWIDRGYNLPVDPSILLKLIELGRNPDASPEQYAGVISASNSLTGKILSSVNSSWFGVRQTVRKPTQAVNLLGMVSVRMLAITHCLAAFHERVILPEQVMRQYWQAGLIKAESAKYFAEKLDKSVTDEAFLVGLMQDMVMPLMHQLAGDLYDRALEETIDPSELCAREVKRFGMDHASAAAAMGRKVGIPEQLCDVIRCHHDHEALKRLSEEQVLPEAVYFSGLFPHTSVAWAPSQAAAAAEVIDANFGAFMLGAPVNDVLGEIEKRYLHMSEAVRPASTEKLDLPDLLHRATAEIAETATSLVGQVHSLMSNTTQVTSQLSAVNAEAIRLQEQTQIDSLTGILNRAGLQEQGPAVLNRLRREGRSMMLAFVDLDDFKSVNDHHGHDKGDDALRLTASVLSEVAGPAAVVGRYGGDEFVFMLGGVADRAEAEQLARRVLEGVKPGLIAEGGAVIPVGLSIGGVWCETIPATAAFDRLLVGADEMMYSAKGKDADSVQLMQLIA